MAFLSAMPPRFPYRSTSSGRNFMLQKESITYIPSAMFPMVSAPQSFVISYSTLVHYPLPTPGTTGFSKLDNHVKHLSAFTHAALLCSCKSKCRRNR